MELTLWMQWYQLILEDFGFKRDDDELSAEILNNILDDVGSITPQDIDIKDKVIVFGAGPSLKPNLADLKKMDLDGFTFIAADGATTALLEDGIVPDIVVTDLDGRMNDIITANQQGALMVVHAHGNNREQVEKYTPQLVNIMGTTQSKPLAMCLQFWGIHRRRSLFSWPWLWGTGHRSFRYGFRENSHPLLPTRPGGWPCRLGEGEKTQMG
jgi:uncharacterized Rossmann fold enzyme